MPSDDEARENIAANLQRILLSRGLTQTDLARATGDPVATISRIYKGQNQPLAGVLARIAEALDVSVDRLLSPPPPAAGNASVGNLATPEGGFPVKVT